MQEIRLERTTSDSIHFRQLIYKLDDELSCMYGDSQEEFDQFNVVENLNTVVIAYLNDVPAGCGCFKKFNHKTVEIKRMYVDPAHRGKKISSAILMELESWAKKTGMHSMILETGTIQLPALSLYRKHGFSLIPNFEPYIGNELSICLQKMIL